MSRKPSIPKAKKKEESINIINNFGKTLLSNVKLDIKFKNEAQRNLSHTIKTNTVTVCSGSPGCGKTFLSCYESLVELKTNEKIEKIVLVKSVVTLKAEEIGFLKGTLEEKMEPFIFSFIKNFEKIIGKDKTEQLRNEKIIEILPIAYMRGINIDNAVIIIDEIQNISIDNIRTILTRLGENSKMILLGDTKQIDKKNKQDSALQFLLKNFKNIDGFGNIEFSLEDVVRHPLIKKIEPIFDNYNIKLLNEIHPLEKKSNLKMVKPLIKKSFIDKLKGFLNIK